MRPSLALCGLVLFLSAGVSGLGVPPSATDDWPQWRGPNGAGIGEGTYPDRWSPTEHIAWKTEIPGKGHSSPAVWGDRIFVTTAIEGAEIPGWKAPVHLGFDRKPGYVNENSTGVGHMLTLKVYAIQATTGRILWERTSFEGPPHDDRHKSNTYASSTVATDGKLGLRLLRVRGSLRLRFRRHVEVEDRPGRHGEGRTRPGHLAPHLREPRHSPVRPGDGRRLVHRGASIAPAARRCGAWRAPRAAAGRRRSWSSPPGATNSWRPAPRPSWPTIPRTGRELWTAPGTVSHPIPSVVTGRGLVFAAAGSQAKVLLALRPGAQEEAASRVAWKYNRGTAYVASPIFYGDYLYLVSDGGIMTCLDPVTGAVQYEGGRVPGARDRPVFARRVRRQDPRHERGRRDVRDQGGAETRSARDQLGRRARVGVARARARHGLHPRRASSVRDSVRPESRHGPPRSLSRITAAFGA